MNADASSEADPIGPGRWIRGVEIALISTIFLAIVGIGLVQIGLRNFADTTLPWADPAMRAGVLWIAMLAGVLAAGTGQHIRIDVLLKALPDRLAPLVERVVLLATALICVALAAASVSLVRLEYSLGDVAFLGIPRWLVLVIIPVGFGLMGWRFTLRALLPARRTGA